MSTENKIITCKAAVAFDFNSELKIESVKVGPPPPEHVRIKMVACALCHTDLSMMESYIPTQPLPFIPGHEGAGIVESVGEGVRYLSKGDRVLTLALPRCYNCHTCFGSRSNYCLDFKRKLRPPGAFLRTENLDGSSSFSLSASGKNVYLGLGTSSLSEYTVIPENSCVKISPDAPLEKVCMMACGFTTGFGASANVVDIKPGESAAVWGLGGVGLSCVMGCKDKHAGTIIGIDVSDDKKEFAMKLGCTDYIAKNSLGKTSLPEKIMEITTFGLDFAFVCVGNPRAMEEACKCVGLGGTVVLVGVPKVSDTMTIAPIDLLGSRKIIGTVIGDYNIHRDIPLLVERYLKGELPIDDFVTRTISLTEVNNGFGDMKQGRGIRTIVIF